MGIKYKIFLLIINILNLNNNIIIGDWGLGIRGRDRQDVRRNIRRTARIRSNEAACPLRDVNRREHPRIKIRAGDRRLYI